MRTTRRSDSILYKRHYQFYNGCTNPNSNAWQTYGGRGIKIYRPWASLKQGFDLFEDWIIANLGAPPQADSIIRRIDSTKDIKPGNLEWSTRRIQSNNRTTNHRIRIGGQTKSMADWCRIYGKNLRTVWSRINDHGYTPKKALEL
jgi:hypothetical protein